MSSNRVTEEETYADQNPLDGIVDEGGGALDEIDEEYDSGGEEEGEEEEREEVVVKMEDLDANETFLEHLNDQTDCKMEISVDSELATPPKMKWKQLSAAFKATESEDALRNIDVILRFREMKKNAVIDWVLNHKCCPQTYKEHAQTDEGKIETHFCITPELASCCAVSLCKTCLRSCAKGPQSIGI